VGGVTARNPIVVGLDLSYTGTGIARWSGGRLSVRTVRTERPDHDHNGWSWPRRQLQIVQAIVRQLGQVGDQVLVCKEDRLPSMDVAGNSALDLAGLHAVVDYVLASRQVPIAKVNLMHLKQYATGKGNATKDDMVAAAERTFPILVANDNEADALWLLAMALHKYGAPLTQVPVARAVKIDRTTWPVFANLGGRP
jgi:Holliday junction resolvasome RuvABC endonuclease subunit